MLLNKVVNALDDLLDYFTSNLKANITDYCEIETPNTIDTFVAKDGSVGSIVELHGVTNEYTMGTFHEQVVEPFYELLVPFFNKAGHAIQVYYSMNPTGVRGDLEENFKNSRKTLKDMGINFDDLIDAKINVLDRALVKEKIYFVLWSRPSLLSKTEMQDEINHAKVTENKIMHELSKDALNPVLGFKTLTEKHQDFTQVFVKALGSIGVSASVLKISSALREMRRSVDPTTTDDWKPLLPGQIVYPSVRRKLPERKKFDAMSPPTSWQLLPSDGRELTDKVCKIGDNLFSAVGIEVMPKVDNSVWFYDIANKINAHGIPWRMSFLMYGDGLSSFAFKKTFATFLLFTNKGNNLLLRDSLDFLQEVKDQDVGVIVQAQMMFATWSPVEYIYDATHDGQLNLKTITQNAEKLRMAIETWAEAQVTDVFGDCIEGVLSSALGIKKSSLASKTAMPLDSALAMLPIIPKTSEWDKGSMMFSSTNSKMMPYKFFSKKQTTFITFIWAPPGFGKSVLMNALNLGLLMDEDNTEIPFIRSIDVGESSFGFGRLLQDRLPEDKKHLVVMDRFRNDRNKSINPFDTKLGCRQPLPTERKFLVNFLKAILSDDEGKIPNGIGGLVEQLVDQMYIYYSDKQKPKKYTMGYDKFVDNALKELRYSVNEHTTWWNIVDALALKGKIMEAKRAQRFAVPILPDANTVVSDAAVIQNMYKIRKSEGDEKVIDEFIRLTSEALSRFPVLTGVTQIDYGNARYATLDFDEVKSAGPRDIEIFYMLGINILTREFFVSKDEAASTPASTGFDLSDKVPVEFYRNFHLKSFTKMREDKKRLNIDEFHTTKGRPYIVDIIEEYERLGRKYNVDITIASQALEDFTPQMLEFASNLYMLGPLEEAQIVKVRGLFSLTEAEQVMLNKVTGRNFVFLGRFKMSKGAITRTAWSSFALKVILSPEENWAFNTTTLNALVRDKLYKAIGGAKTLKLLSTLYPNPDSLSDSVQMNENQSAEERKNLTDMLVKKIIEEGNKRGILNQIWG
jgi:icmB